MRRLLLWLSGRLTVIVVVIMAFVLGYVLHGCLAPESPVKPGDGDQAEGERAPVKEVWTCSMDPQIRMDKPGKCPICGMDLVLASAGQTDESESSRRLVMSPAAKERAEIRTAPVERKFVTAEIRMVGKVDYDETRLKYISAWVPGRLDRLYVDYTGVPVQEGDHLVYLYSPDLLAAQQELLQALRAAEEVKDSSLELIRETARATVIAAREKLRLLGLAQEQVAELEKRGTPIDHLTIRAPIGGIVIHKNATEGMYVKTGTRIYTIADLSRVWIKLDAYESDMMWIRYGQEVEFTTESHPGKTFIGRIAFIDPMLSQKSRTVKLRVNVDNAEGKLKPGMFVRAVVRSKVAAGGRVMDAERAGKWICRMHPDVVREEAGMCDQCGMPLERSESLGYASADPEAMPPLVIPASAPLLTGKRGVVYVEVPDAEKPTYEGRTVELGPRAGDYYLVASGLEEGDMVVMQGNFVIDSSLQIAAKPSMMTPKEDTHEEPEETGATDTRPHAAKRIETTVAFQDELRRTFEAYLAVQDALSRDSAADAAAAAEALGQVLAGGAIEEPGDEARAAWTKKLHGLRKTVGEMGKADGIGPLRKGFALLSEQLADVLKTFGTGSEAPAYQLRCPMAFDGRGALWLQSDKDVRNPYFGAAMPRCGEVTETIRGGDPDEHGGHGDE